MLKIEFNQAGEDPDAELQSVGWIQKWIDLPLEVDFSSQRENKFVLHSMIVVFLFFLILNFLFNFLFLRI